MSTTSDSLVAWTRISRARPSWSPDAVSVRDSRFAQPDGAITARIRPRVVTGRRSTASVCRVGRADVPIHDPARGPGLRRPGRSALARGSREPGGDAITLTDGGQRRRPDRWPVRLRTLGVTVRSQVGRSSQRACQPASSSCSSRIPGSQSATVPSSMSVSPGTPSIVPAGSSSAGRTVDAGDLHHRPGFEDRGRPSGVRELGPPRRSGRGRRTRRDPPALRRGRS